MELAPLEKRTYTTLRIMERKYASEAAKVLRDALNEMRAAMTVIYDKYATDGVLSLADMTRYNRLRNLEGDILSTMNTATRANLAEIRRLKPEQYGEAFFRYAWAVDQATGVSLKWGALNRQAIIESLDNRLYQIAAKDYASNAQAQILRAVNSGLAQGKSYRDMARDLRDAINTSMFRAHRIIQTEAHTAASAAHTAVYAQAEAQGVELQVQWISRLDDRTRDTHRAMDGAIRQDDGLFDGPGGERAPYPGWQGLSAKERINCHCDTIGIVEDYSPSLRRTRDGGVVPYTNYAEWKAGHATWK